MLDKTRNVIALPTYNIEKKGKFWFYWKTPFFTFEEEHKGPYSSLPSVCLIIARELLNEALRRFQK